MFSLTDKDRAAVKTIIKTGDSARVINRAHVLNMRDKDVSIMEVADFLEFTPRTVINITNNYEQGGLGKALQDDPRPGRPPKFDDRIKSKIVAVVCSDAPEGFDRWTLELLKEAIEKNDIAPDISKESIRLILKEHDIKPWQEKMWCIGKLDEEYIRRMEDVLDVYEREYDASRPVVCMDEKPVPLQGDIRATIPCKPGSPLKRDSEYSRHGSANVFCAVEPKVGQYTNTVTERRTGDDFAKFIGSIERRYSAAERIVLIMDNLNTHCEASLIGFYGEENGRALWKRFEVHYTPKHASWLNQAEIAIGMYSRQCLGNTRIADVETLRKKTKAWNRIANRKNITINWKFTSTDARDKFQYS